MKRDDNTYNVQVFKHGPAEKIKASSVKELHDKVLKINPNYGKDFPTMVQSEVKRSDDSEWHWFQHRVFKDGPFVATPLQQLKDVHDTMLKLNLYFDNDLLATFTLESGVPFKKARAESKRSDDVSLTKRNDIQWYRFSIVKNGLPAWFKANRKTATKDVHSQIVKINASYEKNVPGWMLPFDLPEARGPKPITKRAVDAYDYTKHGTAWYCYQVFKNGQRQWYEADSNALVARKELCERFMSVNPTDFPGEYELAAYAHTYRLLCDKNPNHKRAEGSVHKRKSPVGTAMNKRSVDVGLVKRAATQWYCYRVFENGPWQWYEVNSDYIIAGKELHELFLKINPNWGTDFPPEALGELAAYGHIFFQFCAGHPNGPEQAGKRSEGSVDKRSTILAKRREEGNYYVISGPHQPWRVEILQGEAAQLHAELLKLNPDWDRDFPQLAERFRQGLPITPLKTAKRSVNSVNSVPDKTESFKRSESDDLEQKWAEGTDPVFHYDSEYTDHKRSIPPSSAPENACFKSPNYVFNPENGDSDLHTRTTTFDADAGLSLAQSKDPITKRSADLNKRYDGWATPICNSKAFGSKADYNQINELMDTLLMQNGNPKVGAGPKTCAMAGCKDGNSIWYCNDVSTYSIISPTFFPILLCFFPTQKSVWVDH